MFKKKQRPRIPTETTAAHSRRVLLSEKIDMKDNEEQKVDSDEAVSKKQQDELVEFDKSLVKSENQADQPKFLKTKLAMQDREDGPIVDKNSNQAIDQSDEYNLELVPQTSSNIVQSVRFTSSTRQALQNTELLPDSDSSREVSQGQDNPNVVD